MEEKGGSGVVWTVVQILLPIFILLVGYVWAELPLHKQPDYEQQELERWREMYAGDKITLDQLESGTERILRRKEQQ